MADTKKTTQSAQTFKVSMDQMEYTSYEKARMIGARALQIAQGAEPLIKFSDEEVASVQFNPIEIAKREFAEGVIPIEVHRKLPTEGAAPASEEPESKEE